MEQLLIDCFADEIIPKLACVHSPEQFGCLTLNWKRIYNSVCKKSFKRRATEEAQQLCMLLREDDFENFLRNVSEPYSKYTIYVIKIVFELCISEAALKTNDQLTT